MSVLYTLSFTVEKSHQYRTPLRSATIQRVADSVERVQSIELWITGWKPVVLPLNYTRFIISISVTHI